MPQPWTAVAAGWSPVVRVNDELSLDAGPSSRTVPGPPIHPTNQNPHARAKCSPLTSGQPLPPPLLRTRISFPAPDSSSIPPPPVSSLAQEVHLMFPIQGLHGLHDTENGWPRRTENAVNHLKNLAGNKVSLFLFRFDICGDAISFVLNEGIAEDMTSTRTLMRS